MLNSLALMLIELKRHPPALCRLLTLMLHTHAKRYMMELNWSETCCS
jgi:hypothetical protein